MGRFYAPRPAQTGFTIVELVISISLFGILIPVISSTIMSLARIDGQTRNIVSLNAMVEAKVESLRATDFSNLPVGTTDFTSDMPASVKAPRSAQYVTSISSLSPDIKQIDIDISYSESGSPQYFSYRTYIENKL